GYLDQRSFPWCRMNGKMGSVGLDHRLGQWQAKPGAITTTAAQRVELLERFERLLDFGLGHADAGIADAHHHIARRLIGGGDDHLPAGLSVSYGIGENVECYLTDGTEVRHHVGQA